ncbi:hypothetical protein DSM104299_02370 [Baekduia alba]|uniref:hypothetical protein n=1 Tax=Baekduia alba TaxID=2997333 RepID=UPI00234097B7|nr:hypothetical protein [Baekduia alba]WCB93654.1 hypothetical protein DSM104299_02370 [Baekduia alba]
MPSKSCCRSCPRCNDCPVLVAAAARSRRRDPQAITVSSLVEDVFAGVGITRTLPDSVTRTLESLDAARRGDLVAAGPAS